MAMYRGIVCNVPAPLARPVHAAYMDERSESAMSAVDRRLVERCTMVRMMGSRAGEREARSRRVGRPRYVVKPGCEEGERGEVDEGEGGRYAAGRVEADWYVANGGRGAAGVSGTAYGSEKGLSPPAGGSGEAGAWCRSAPDIVWMR